MLSPSAANAAITSETEARRSVAITGAPFSAGTPSTMALSPSSFIRAPKSGQFLDMHEAVLENRLGDARGAFGAGHQRHELRLKVGRESGEGRGGDIDRLDAVAVARNAQALRRGFDLRARFGQDVERRLEMFGPCALQQHVAAGHGGRHGVGAGLDAVGQHAMLGAAEPRDALDLDHRRAGALDLGAHFHQKIGQIANFRLARGVADQCRPLGERRRHQGHMGAADRDLGKIDLAAAQAPAGRPGDDVTGVDVDRGPEALHRHQQEIDRAGADGAAAGQ